MRPQVLSSKEQVRAVVFVGLLALPFLVGFLASSFTGRPTRVYASPIICAEFAIYLVYALFGSLRTGRVTGERYGARATYSRARARAPVGFWSVILLYLGALLLFGWLGWQALTKLMS